MRKFALALIPALLFLAYSVPAMADPHPSGGFASEGRNAAGFGGGPHCHINTKSNSPFDFTPAFPSHQAHVSSGFGELGEGPFVADPNCDGDPGN
jgi:hypothetical protein